MASVGLFEAVRTSGCQDAGAAPRRGALRSRRGRAAPWPGRPVHGRRRRAGPDGAPAGDVLAAHVGAQRLAHQHREDRADRGPAAAHAGTRIRGRVVQRPHEHALHQLLLPRFRDGT